MADQWSAAAEAYSANLLVNTDGSGPRFSMQHGRKLIVTRVATFLKGKVVSLRLSFVHARSRTQRRRCPKVREI